MFIVNRHNWSKFKEKVNKKNLLRLPGSLVLYLRVQIYRLFGVTLSTNRSFGRRVLVVAHLGIGDFFNLLPAYKHLARGAEEVCVLVREANLPELARFVSKVRIKLLPIEREAILDDYYKLDVNVVRRNHPDYRVLTVGSYSQKFTFYYPLSYYIELGVPPEIAFNESIMIAEEELRPEARQLSRDLGTDYIFTHLKASDWKAQLPEHLRESRMTIIDPIENHNLRGGKGFDLAQRYLEARLNLIEHCFFLQRSAECYLIDSAFYNFLAHAEYSGKAMVFMRSWYFHTLDSRLTEKFQILKTERIADKSSETRELQRQ
jgi:hypothetical protein